MSNDRATGFVFAFRTARPRVVLLCQLLATAAILGWVPGNSAKLVAMLVVWRFGFGHISRPELLAMGGVNVLFLLMNSAALERGIFAFDHPDFLRMPVYEYLMWGFYTLHTIRLLGGPAPQSHWIKVLAAVGAFALPFGTISDSDLLFAASASVLLACLVLFHERMDLVYAGYMAVLGALIEYVGVWTGQWHYPGHHLGGVPPWFLTMWAGVGLFSRRVVLPLLRRSDRLQSQQSTGIW